MRTLVPVIVAILTCAGMAMARSGDVRLRIWQQGDDEKIITRANLLKVKQFILQRGQRETYCNMYNDNPAFHTKGFHFYLNPDTGQQNINCDLAKSDFHSLTIRAGAGGQNQYRTVEFLDQHAIYVTVGWPTDNLTVGELRKLVEDALVELLAEMDQKKPAADPEATR